MASDSRFKYDQDKRTEHRAQTPEQRDARRDKEEEEQQYSEFLRT